MNVSLHSLNSSLRGGRSWRSSPWSCLTRKSGICQHQSPGYSFERERTLRAVNLGMRRISRRRRKRRRRTGFPHTTGHTFVLWLTHPTLFLASMMQRAATNCSEGAPECVSQQCPQTPSHPGKTLENARNSLMTTVSRQGIIQRTRHDNSNHICSGVCCRTFPLVVCVSASVSENSDSLSLMDWETLCGSFPMFPHPFCPPSMRNRW